jgi:hypothetical protein
MFYNGKNVREMTLEEQVSLCFNQMINGNVTNEELYSWYTKEVVDEALEMETEYLNNLNII